MSKVRSEHKFCFRASLRLLKGFWAAKNHRKSVTSDSRIFFLYQNFYLWILLTEHLLLFGKLSLINFPKSNFIKNNYISFMKKTDVSFMKKTDVS